MKWYLAIKYSHKCFLLFLVINLIFELFLKIGREFILFKEKDLFDIINKKFKDPETHKANFNNMTYDDLEKHFMKPFHIFNSSEKIKVLYKNSQIHNFNNMDKDEKIKSKREENKLKLISTIKFKTVNFFDLYKNNKI